MAEPIINPPAKVAIIGLGNMGLPMAARLIDADYHVHGVDLSARACQQLRSLGGHAHEDANAAVKDAAAVITVLPDGKIVRAALESLRGSLMQGCTVIEMSSSDPRGTGDLGADFIAAGFEFIDAPISGGVKRAIDGSLTIMVGGNPTTIDRVTPILNALGKTIFRTGALGSGHAMKALNNYVSAAGLVAAVEAVHIGGKFGLDVDMMADIFNASTGRNNTTELKLKQFINSKAFNAGFPLRLMAKDVKTADDLAQAIGVPAPLADFCANLWVEASSALGNQADHTEIGRHIERLSVRK